MSVTEQSAIAKRNPLPDIGDILFLFVLQLLVLTLPGYVLADGDTGWHIVSGQYILKTLSIPHQDLISATFPQAAWVAYEWLSDLVMAVFVQIGGVQALAVACSLAIAWLFLLLYEDCRAEGCHFVLALTITIIGAIASSVHWLARPHLFVYFGIYVFSRMLEKYRRGTVGRMKLFAVLTIAMLIWVNVHPAFVIGFVLLSIYFVSDLLIAVFAKDQLRKQSALSRLRDYALAFGCVLLATLVNPYGIGLYKYILHYSHANVVINATEEFQSPVFHGQLQQSCLEILFALVVVGVLVCKKKPSLPQLLSVLAFGHLALFAVRGGPMFVIVAVPFIGFLLSGQSEPGQESLQNNFGSEPLVWWQKLVDWYQRLGDTVDATEKSCNMHLVPALTSVVLLAMTAIPSVANSTFIKEIGFDAKRLPTKTLTYIRENNLDPAHGFNLDNWGGYLRYQLDKRVFIDDRADFYPVKFYLLYAKINTVLPGWQEELDNHKINWVLTPKGGRLEAELKITPGWKLAAEDQASALFIRTDQR
jgi:hypothetical protein